MISDMHSSSVFSSQHVVQSLPEAIFAAIDRQIRNHPRWFPSLLLKLVIHFNHLMWVPLKARFVHAFCLHFALLFQCGAHLGHIFDDGPRPTGKRYCLHILVPYFILSPHWQSWHEDNPKSYILYFSPTNTDIRYPINHLKKSSEYNADLYVFLLLLFLHTSL